MFFKVLRFVVWFACTLTCTESPENRKKQAISVYLSLNKSKQEIYVNVYESLIISVNTGECRQWEDTTGEENLQQKSLAI
jgi:hypothetical protein